MSILYPDEEGKHKECFCYVNELIDSLVMLINIPKEITGFQCMCNSQGGCCNEYPLSAWLRQGRDIF